MENHNNETILSLKEIRKEYPGVVALNDVSFDLKKGEVHALLGENGAGKSTLIKVISGAIVPNAGSIVTADGKEHLFMTPALSHEYGIETIYQELNMINTMTVAENICFGEKFGRLVNRKAMNEKAKKVLDRFGLDISPTQKVQYISNAYKQIVEIAKSISRQAKIIIMDEPTAPLSVSEVESLFKVIEELKKEGVSIIYISHRIEELFRICDRVTVMRDGEKIETFNIEETDRKTLINLMVGRDFADTYPSKKREIGEVTLKVEGLCTNVVEDISFEARRGEILGISGLVGSGRTELVRGVIGADKKACGEVYVNGVRKKIKSPKNALDCGMALIPEDRKGQGVFLTKPISWNIPFIYQAGDGFFVSKKKSSDVTDKYIDALSIKTPNSQQLVKNLSGGNQQKVVVAKTLAADMDVIIFDEPTRGIDVGAKEEIYILMDKLAKEGKTIIMISSDMVELIGMCNRIMVICEGKMTAMLEGDEITQAAIMEAASGNM